MTHGAGEPKNLERELWDFAREIATSQGFRFDPKCESLFRDKLAECMKYRRLEEDYEDLLSAKLSLVEVVNFMIEESKRAGEKYINASALQAGFRNYPHILSAT